MNEQKEQISTGIDPKLKKEINEEGYDENGGYLLVGTPEERDLARQRMESEGRTESLGAYIKLHKEIFLPKEEIDPEFIKEINKNKGKIWLSGGGNLGSDLNFKYIDKEGNVAKVNIDFQKISSLKDKNFTDCNNNWDQNWEFFNMVMTKELESLKFEYCVDEESIVNLIHEIHSQQGKYQGKIESEAKERKKEEFDF